MCFVKKSDKGLPGLSSKKMIVGRSSHVFPRVVLGLSTSRPSSMPAFSPSLHPLLAKASSPQYEMIPWRSIAHSLQPALADPCMSLGCAIQCRDSPQYEGTSRLFEATVSWKRL
jgi:hypothetical protein